MLDEFRQGPDPRTNGRDGKAGSLHQHIGQAITVTIAGYPTGDQEQIGLIIQVTNNITRLRAVPCDTTGNTEAGGLCLQIGEQLATTGMMPMPVKLVRQLRQCLQNGVQPLLAHRPAHGQQAQSAVPNRLGGFLLRNHQIGRIEAVIDEMHRFRSLGQRAQMSAISGGTGHSPERIIELLHQFPILAGIDILGMGRNREGQIQQSGRIAGDRAGRMDEVGIEQISRARQFMRQYQRLSQPADTIGTAVTFEIAPPQAQH